MSTCSFPTKATASPSPRTGCGSTPRPSGFSPGIWADVSKAPRGDRAVASPRVKDGVILVHGGCGGAQPTARQLAAIRDALDEGYALLETGGSRGRAVGRRAGGAGRRGWV